MFASRDNNELVVESNLIKYLGIYRIGKAFLIRMRIKLIIPIRGKLDVKKSGS